MPRSKSMWTTFNKAYRTAYRVHRAVVTGRVLSSRNPQRVERLFARRLAYKAFAKFINRVLR